MIIDETPPVTDHAERTEPGGAENTQEEGVLWYLMRNKKMFAWLIFVAFASFGGTCAILQAVQESRQAETKKIDEKKPAGERKRAHEEDPQ